MPLIGDNDSLETHDIPGSPYQFSAVRIDSLGSSEYTLVGLCVDSSSSVGSFSKELHDCLQEVVKSCRHSPRADNLMLRVVEFNSDIHEIHGFKPLTECDAANYANALHIGGMTALYDAAYNVITSVAKYGADLSKADYSCNGILIIVTDGEDNRSTFTPANVKQALKDAMKTEALESLQTILIGVGVSGSTSTYLQDFKDKAGIDQYVEIGSANAKSLAKLADFISRSVSSASQALGTGGKSQALSF